MWISVTYLLLLLAFHVIQNNSTFVIYTTEFENINYCNYGNAAEMVLTACKRINNDFGGGCMNAVVTLTDSYNLEHDQYRSIGQCWTSEAYWNCVTDDTDTTSDLLVWTYDAVSQRCTPSEVKTGDGSKRKVKKSKKGDKSGGGDGDYAIGIPVSTSYGSSSKGRGRTCKGIF